MSSLVHRLISQMRAFCRDERGDMAEAAITTPVIILLMVVILNFGMLAYTAQAAENAANYGARRGSVAQRNAVGEAISAAAYAANQALIGEYTVHAIAPGGIAGAELGIRVTYRVPNLMAPLGSMFPGLPRGDFTGDATAIFRQEGW